MRANIVSVWHFGQGGRGIWIIMLALDWAGARHSQSPVTANAGGDGTIMIFGFHCRRSILLTFTDLMAVANAAFSGRRDFGKTRSIPSTTMIATTMNAAISERARLKLAQQTSHRSSVCRDRTRCRQWPKTDQAPLCRAGVISTISTTSDSGTNAKCRDVRDTAAIGG